MQDQNTPVTQSQEQVQQVPTQPESDSKKKPNSIIILFLLLFTSLLSCAIGIGVYWFLTKDKEAEPEQKQNCTHNNETYDNGETFDAGDDCNECFCDNGKVTCTLLSCDTVDETQLTEYESDNFKMKFKYPSEWGEVDERVIDQNGSSEVIISFTENPYLYLEGTNSNFDPGSIGDICPILAYFKGWDESEETPCEKWSEFQYNSTGYHYFGCTKGDIGLGSQSYYYGPTNHCAGYKGFLRIVKINTPTEDFPGIMLVLEVVNSQSNDLALTGKETESIEGEDMASSYLDIWNSIKADIETTGDYLTTKQLEEFDTFLSTIEFVE
ncbi:hypothetical protein JW766_01345 [Candidatus Dojkabacteria bacterium]|nr:hypothetical protein [Candidatus Dojkabacteria bacterium]